MIIRVVYKLHSEDCSDCKLREVNTPILDDSIVQRLLDSLLIDFERLKISYTILGEKWSINEWLSFCVQEEKDWVARELIKLIDYGWTDQEKQQCQQKVRLQKKNNQGNNSNPSSSLKAQHKGFKWHGTFFFCKKKGHYKHKATMIISISWKEYLLSFHLLNLI